MKCMRAIMSVYDAFLLGRCGGLDVQENKDLLENKDKVRNMFRRLSPEDEEIYTRNTMGHLY